MLGEVWCCISERCQDQDTFLVTDGSWGGFNVVEVNMRDCTRIDFVSFVVIEEDWCLKVLIPRDHLIYAHLRWRFRRPKTIITVTEISISAARFIEQTGDFRRRNKLR